MSNGPNSLTKMLKTCSHNIGPGHDVLQEYRPHIRYIKPNLTECDLDWRSRRRWLASPRYGDAPFPHIRDAKFPQDTRLLRAFPQEWMYHPDLRPRRVLAPRTERPSAGLHRPAARRSQLHSTDAFTDGRKNNHHAVIGTRPYISPEYSPAFYKFSSSLCHYGTSSNFKADTFIPLRTSNTRLPYIEKKKLWEKQEEIQEVKKLEQWQPADSVFKTLLEGLEAKGS